MCSGSEKRRMYDEKRKTRDVEYEEEEKKKKRTRKTRPREKHVRKKKKKKEKKGPLGMYTQTAYTCMEEGNEKQKKKKKKNKQGPRGRPGTPSDAPAGARPPGRALAAPRSGNLGEWRAYPQRIVAARLLYRLQDPFALPSRLQGIRPRPRRNCNTRRTRGALPPRGTVRRLGCVAQGLQVRSCCVREVSPLSGTDSDLEAFSHYPAGGSVAALPCRTAAETNYPNQRFLSY